MPSGAQDQATTPPTVLLVVESVRVYRRGGASLTELARALSIEITVPRGWWDQHTHKKPRLLRPENLPDIWTPATATNQALRTQGVLACTGDTRPGRNDVARELAIIRDRVQPRFIMTEHTMIELAELPKCVDRSHPTALHIAAHSHDGTVFLTHSGEPISVQHTHPSRLCW
jgi:transposase-like protein